ncbi:uncharacterized protein [Drosophila takahashii]|uniref:uncharacterized protein n=1 Tax=Drosophila takahashii TaxID=29030 RepID=UPI0038991A6F
MEVIAKLNSGEYKRIEASGSSEVWQCFFRIIHGSTGENVDYVGCKRASDSTTVGPAFKKTRMVVSDQMKYEVTKSCCKFVAKDLRSFDQDLKILRNALSK